MKKHTLRRPALMLLALSLAPGLAWSQDAAKSDAPSNKPSMGDEEPIVLSPFTVDTTKDKGYKVTNATSGTRLNTKIKDTPLNLEVVTNDFMRDTGATNLREALRYSAGVVLESQSDALTDTDMDPGAAQTAGANDPRGATRKVGDSSIKLRGFVIDQVLRDGFRRQYPTDWINIERLEVVRGPSALLYGVGSLGGVVNYIAKRPEYKDANYLGFTIGNHGFYRGEFDSTGALGKNNSWKPAFRVSGAYEQTQNETQYYTQKHFFISPSLLFKPTPTTTVLLDNEFGYKGETGVGFQSIRSGWDGAGRNGAFIGEKYMDLRTYRWSGPDTYLKGPFRNNLIDVEQRVGEDLVFKAGVAQSKATFNSRQIGGGKAGRGSDAGFSPTDPYSYSYGVTGSKLTIGTWTGEVRDALLSAQAATDGKFQGKTFAEIATQGANSYRVPKLSSMVENHDIAKDQANQLPETLLSTLQYYWDTNNKVELRNQIRIEGVYNKDLGKWGKHTLLTGIQYMKMETTTDDYRPYHTSDNDIGDAPAKTATYSYHNPMDFGVFHYGVQGDGTPDPTSVHTTHVTDFSWDTGYYAVYQAKLLRDRVTLIGGLRWDRSDARKITNYTYVPPGMSRPDLVQQRGVYGNSDYMSKLKQMGITLDAGNNRAASASSPQIGLNVEVVKGLSVFGLYSTGEVPNPNTFDGYGQCMKPTKVQNYEAGVKFDLWEGRISGTVSAYRILRQGQPKFIWWAPSPFNALQGGFDPSKPISVFAGFATPEALWRGLHNVPGKTAAEELAVAKTMYGQFWWPLLTELANTATESAAQSGDVGKTFWSGPVKGWDDSLAGIASANSVGTTVHPANDGAWFPLINLSNAANNAFWAAAFNGSGWFGNYYVNAGEVYRYGDGTYSTGNYAGGKGANVPMNDQATGWDASFVITPIDNMQIMLNFAHVDRKVTSRTYQFVQSGFVPGSFYYASDNNYGNYDNTKPGVTAYTDPTNTATYNVTTPDYGQAEDDTPRNTASVWVHYNLDGLSDSLKGWEIGSGGSWEDNRMWYTGVVGTGNVSYVNGTKTLLKLYTKERYTFNSMLAYNTTLSNKYKVRYAFNVTNLLNDTDRYGLVFAPGIGFRFHVGISF